jgi:transcriptional regulator with XRE-family HTH domain
VENDPDPSPDLTDKRFGENLRMAREQAGLSGAQLAKRMQDAGYRSIYQQTIVRVEAGGQPVKLREALELARICGTTLDALTRPPELAILAARIRSAARDVREARRQLAVLTRQRESDAGRLRELVGEAVERGATVALADEIRVAEAALGDGKPPRPGSEPRAGRGTTAIRNPSDVTGDNATLS